MQRMIFVVALLCTSILFAQNVTNTGRSTASGTCAVSHSGNNDIITIKNCGVGEVELKKLENLIHALVENRDEASLNSKLDELLEIVRKSAPRTIPDADKQQLARVLGDHPGVGVRVSFGTGSDTAEFAKEWEVIFARANWHWEFGDDSGVLFGPPPGMQIHFNVANPDLTEDVKKAVTNAARNACGQNLVVDDVKWPSSNIAIEISIGARP